MECLDTVSVCLFGAEDLRPGSTGSRPHVVVIQAHPAPYDSDFLGEEFQLKTQNLLLPGTPYTQLGIEGFNPVLNFPTATGVPGGGGPRQARGHDLRPGRQAQAGIPSTLNTQHSTLNTHHSTLNTRLRGMIAALVVKLKQAPALHPCLTLNHPHCTRTPRPRL